MEKLLTTTEVADFLSVAPATLKFWRHRGTGPTACKVGRAVRYRGSDIQSWLEDQAGARPSSPAA